MNKKHAYSYEELIQCGKGELFGSGNAQLPLPPMLMFDRITHISREGGKYNKGQVIAELDIHPDLWFYQCHFQGDPVMPGCLGVDAMWQLIGFFLAWLGQPGYGRALGAGETKFSGQVTPDKKLVTYTIDLNRIILRKLVLGVADAEMSCDGETFYTAKNLKVCLFHK